MRSVAISEQGTRLSAEGDCLVLSRGDYPVRRFRAADLDQLLIYGHVDVTHGAILLLLRRGVDLVWLTQGGQFRARLLGALRKNSLLRLAQYRRVCDPQFAASIARRVVATKIYQQRQILLRAQRRLRDEQVAGAVGELRLLSERVEKASDLDVLRGLEGRAAAVYFAQFGRLILNSDFTFTGRNRRPPRDPVNAMLSFGYAVLGSHLLSDLLTCGLDPLLGFFHQPVHGRPALMLDLLEMFRPWVDQLVLRTVNRRQIGLGDFDRRSEQPLELLLSENDAVAGDDVLDGFTWPDANGNAQPDGDDSSVPQSPPLRDGERSRALHPSPLPETASDSPSGTTVPPPFDDWPTGVTQHSLAKPGTRVVTQATEAQPQLAVGVYLNETGRKIFLAEFFQKLREERYYPRREARFSTRDIMREEMYHLARVIEGKEECYEPFILDER